MTRQEIIASLPVNESTGIRELREYAMKQRIPFGLKDGWNTILYKIREDAWLKAKKYYRIQTISGRILEHVEQDEYEGNIHNYMGELSIQHGIPLDELEFVTVTGKQLEEEAA